MDETPTPPQDSGQTPQLPQMPPQPQMPPPGYAPQPHMYAPQTPPKSGNETGSLVTGIVGVCFASLGAGWSFIGGSCCGWAGWPLAFIGLILAIISLALKRSVLGWVALGLSIFAFVWVFVSGFLFATVVTRGAQGVMEGAGSGVSRPYYPPNTTPRSGTSGGQMTTPGTNK